MFIVHPFKPVYNKQSQILILGSFPSVLSRKNMFYYANPSNRFWKILSYIYEQNIYNSVEAKTSFLLNNKIALYDVVYSCSIVGSSDSSINNVMPCDIDNIIKNSDIKHILLNGKTAFNLFNKHFANINANSLCLPSSSAANAKYSLQALQNEWLAKFEQIV